MVGRPDLRTQESKIIAACERRIQECMERTSAVRTKWAENFAFFDRGSRFNEKQPWQADFTVNEIAASIRSATGGIRTNFLKRPDWFELTGMNSTAKQWAGPLEKIMRVHLKRAKFRRQVNTFLLMSSINMGAMRVGFNIQRLRNPRLTIHESQKQVRQINKKLAPYVENPMNPLSLGLGTDDFFELMDPAFQDFQSFATSSKMKTVKEKIPQFIQRGSLELLNINPDMLYWDPDVSYLQDSPWIAFDTFVPVWQLRELEKQGVYKNTAQLQGQSITQRFQDKSFLDARYKKISSGTPQIGNGLARVTEYFGVVVVNDEAMYLDRHVVYANGSVILKNVQNPFWADGFESPFVTAAVHEIPFRPTAQGLVDNAIGLQKALDSNYHLIIDQMRLAIVGMNVIDKTKLVDSTVLDEGFSPGKWIEVLGDPDKVFKHFNLTSNVENQVFPMNNILVDGIRKATGVSSLQQGNFAPRGRTSKAEIQQVSGSSDLQLATMAEDLEIQFLEPMLEKSLARVLQFGLSNLDDPEIQSVLEDDELYELQRMSEEERYNTLAQFYQFKINGFTAETERLDEADSLMELLKIYNQNGPASYVINGPEVVKDLARKLRLPNADKYVINGSPAQEVFNENAVLLSGHYVAPSQNDPHDFHLQEHMKVASPSEELMKHIEEHQFLMQSMQQAQALTAGGEGSGLPRGSNPSIH